MIEFVEKYFPAMKQNEKHEEISMKHFEKNEKPKWESNSKSKLKKKISTNIEHICKLVHNAKLFDAATVGNVSRQIKNENGKDE